MMQAREALAVLAGRRRGEVVVTTMTAYRLWCRLSSHELDLPLVGSMGKASSLALGVALARPERRVWVIDGDGSLLSNLGSLVTIGHLAPPNLLHFVFHNNMYEMSGGQPLPGAGRVNFCGLATAAGYPHTFDFDDLEEFQLRISEVLSTTGPALVCLRVGPTREPLGPLALRTPEALRRVKAALERG